MIDVTVKRSEWGRGTFCGSRLYNNQTKKRCCLGFVANACGLTDEDICDRSTPKSLYNGTGKIILDSLIILNAVNVPFNSKICSDLMGINDDRYLNESNRESKLIKLGKEAGINFTFVD